MSLSFRKWREMALTEYPVVSDKYYKKVYENIDDGHASDWLRSQKYTLDFIDYCLRLL